MSTPEATVLNVLRRLANGEKVGSLQAKVALQAFRTLAASKPSQEDPCTVTVVSPERTADDAFLDDAAAFALLLERALVELISRRLLIGMNAEFWNRFLQLKSELKRRGYEQHQLPPFQNLFTFSSPKS